MRTLIKSILIACILIVAGLITYYTIEATQGK